ncbi:MAG TPA: FTR1 family protein [Spirochaetia bacterium]|nr:FTR1 family protein [Spirochaetia bacterium]
MRRCSIELDARRSALVLAAVLLTAIASTPADAQATGSDSQGIGTNREAVNALLVTAGGAQVDASAGDWEAARARLDSLARQWGTLSPGGSALTRAVDQALGSARQVLSVPSPRPAEATAALSALAKAVDAYGSSLPSPTATDTTAARQLLVASARSSLRFTEKGDAQAAAGQLASFSAQWSRVENAIRAGDSRVYASVEVGMSRAGAALRATPPNLASARDALGSVAQALESYGQGSGSRTTVAAGQGVTGLLDLLRQSTAAFERGDRVSASAAMDAFIAAWPAVEGEVMARSSKTYALVESDMTEAQALLLSADGDRARAETLLAAMTDGLVQVSGKSRYTIWDSAIILLREGMEALLVLAALLALLRKSERRGSEGWVWAGAGTGLALSAGFAVILGLVLTSAAGGVAREQLEGFVGLASVLLMLTVGAWLHRRSNLQSWNAYLKNKIGSALVTGSMWSVFALACLAVLREGGETVVFYAGIAPAISLLELLGGIAIALVLLVVIGFLIIRYSVKLPLHYFFLVATLLIYYLALKIAGESVHALQVAGTLPSSFGGGLPVVGPLGMYATWETFVPQAVIFLLVVTEFISTEVRRRAGRRSA